MLSVLLWIIFWVLYFGHKTLRAKYIRYEEILIFRYVENPPVITEIDGFVLRTDEHDKR
jgi:hypothetical protein